MNPELKAAWIADLRENPGRQGRTFLRSLYNKYSALGRLHQLAGGTWGALSGARNAYYVSDTGAVSSLSQETLDLAELSYADVQEIVTMNDFQNKTFFEIADWIEENL